MNVSRSERETGPCAETVPPHNRTSHVSPEPIEPSAQRFRGQIAGVGSSSGVCVVVGRWATSPLGSFADAMVERPDGHRVLLAPSEDVADFISATYTFDEVRIEPFTVTGSRLWVVRSPSLTLDLVIGARLPLGWALQTIPYAVATRPAITLVTDPVARVVMRGVRTRGTARPGRREFYAATDLHAIVALEGAFDETPLGSLTPVDPPCTFGFSSTPRTPSVAAVTTTVTTRASASPREPGSPRP